MIVICKNVATYKEFCDYVDEYVNVEKPFSEIVSKESVCGDYFMDLIVDEIDLEDDVTEVDDLNVVYSCLYHFMNFHNVSEVTIVE